MGEWLEVMIQDVNAFTAKINDIYYECDKSRRKTVKRLHDELGVPYPVCSQLLRAVGIERIMAVRAKHFSKDKLDELSELWKYWHSADYYLKCMNSGEVPMSDADMVGVLGMRFGKTVSCIQRVLVGMDLRKPKKRMYQKVPPEVIEQIMMDVNSDMTLAEIGNTYNVSRSFISKLMRDRGLIRQQVSPGASSAGRTYIREWNPEIVEQARAAQESKEHKNGMGENTSRNRKRRDKWRYEHS